MRSPRIRTVRTARWQCWLPFALALLWIAAPVSAQPDDENGQRAADPLVVVVGPDSPIQALELATLRLAYLGELADLHELVMGAGSGGGAPLTLLVYAPDEQRFLRTVAHRTYVQFRRYWARRALAGDSALAPVRVHYLHQVRLRLVRDRRAIGFVRLSEARSLAAEGIRVLPLDGTLPGHPEYPLP